jgi:hypothetical protein
MVLRQRRVQHLHGDRSGQDLVVRLPDVDALFALDELVESVPPTDDARRRVDGETVRATAGG